MKTILSFGPFLTIVVFLVIIFGGLIGWCKNVAAVVGWAADISPEFIGRCLGVFVVPLGVFMGYFG
jgi:hypothetical protein